MDRTGAGTRHGMPLRWMLAAAIILTIGLTETTWAQDAEPAKGSFFDGWRLRLGPSYRKIDSVHVHSAPSHVQRLGLHANGTGATIAGQIGSTQRPADRIYDDGFVKQDAGTANDGNTWLWSYNNASQHDAGAQTLSFTATELIGSAKGNNGSFSEESGCDGLGFSLSMDRPVRQWGGFNVLVGFGLSYNRIEPSPSWEAHLENVYTVTDSYDTSAIEPTSSTTPPWTAPYTGTLAGPGPVISNTPDAGRNLVLAYAGRSTVDMNIDIDLVTVAVSAGLEKDWERFRIAALAGLSVTWVHIDTGRREHWFRQMPDGTRQTLRRWRDDSSNSDFIPGALIELRGEYQLTEQWFIGASARWDLPFTDVDVQAGPNELTMNLEGASGSLYAGFSF
ncbi:MAG: hypothetical protein KAI66_06290 [Lentisphaeria bacterium]|nr:hypothetical protein [Lentisphaeria bacterium]